MGIYLVCTKGEQRGGTWQVVDVPVVLGRSNDCDIVISDSTISRRHCRIYLKGDELHYEYLNARNRSRRQTQINHHYARAHTFDAPAPCTARPGSGQVRGVAPV